MERDKVKRDNKKVRLTEKRVREIAREEIIKWHRDTIVPLSQKRI